MRYESSIGLHQHDAELIELVEKEVKNRIGEDAELLRYQDPSILAEVRENGYVTAKPAARLIAMYMQAVADGADAILNICSSVGEVADSVQDAAAYIGVPVVRIDEEMCRTLCAKAAGSACWRHFQRPWSLQRTPLSVWQGRWADT